MGGGSGRIHFGNTVGSRLDAQINDVLAKKPTNFLDALSTGLSVASLIPGFDTITNLLSIPVDLARGDYTSAGLSALGAIPFIGEVADTAKLAKMADKTSDAVKAAKKVTNFSEFPKNIHIGKQGKHIVGHNNYKKGKSILNISTDTAQNLVKKYSGTGQKIGANRERIDFKRVIGKYVDPKTGKSIDTTIGTVHYSNSGTHIVPEKPINWRK